MKKRFFTLLGIFIGVFCFSFTGFSQVVQLRNSNPHFIPPPGYIPEYKGDKNKDLRCCISDKAFGLLDEKKVKAVRLYNGDDTIMLSLTPGGGSYSYYGQVKDTVYLEVELDGFRKEKMIYIPKLFIADEVSISKSIVIYISREDFYPNEIIVVNNNIEINLGKNKTVLDASQLRQSPDEPIKQTLCRIPGWELKKNAVYFKGQKLDYFFINGDFIHVRHPNFPELFSTFKKYMKNK
jgi:hypothetical protein